MKDFRKFSMEKEITLNTAKIAKSEGTVAGTKSLFWSELNYDHKSTLYLPVIFLFRRAISIIIVIYFRK